ncbi:BatD family protein [Aestuariibacter sp. AA17]|uniref:BatD family protein n=1 Tax=Fluctibacter corallii TaxID=2984329 RepID=A0ABT3A9P5_9ALTE|nr:BatD family protein [Aestuariibacter sp. AA17]MCV2885405.1 BatD family protein [Aestuariibacter sp. AA17]
MVVNIAKWFQRLLLLSALFIPMTTLANVTEVIASVDKNPVMVDESFILTVTANGDAERNAFDSSILMQDFIVGRTSISSQTRMVNFKTDRSTVWSTVLIPRGTGQFTIPAIDIDGKRSKPIQLLVVPKTHSQGSGQRDIYLETHLNKHEVYLQQQLTYTAKLFLAKDITRGSLDAPKLDSAEIRQVGKDKEYNDIINGKRYRIIERTFAIIPQKSGEFSITGPVFQGEVVDSRNRGFGFINPTTTVNRIGDTQTINVIPKPDSYSGNWLASEFVELTEEWHPSTESVNEGDPITRTISLTAVGVVDTQLPDLDVDYPSSVNTYPDKPSSTTVEKDQSLIAQKTFSTAIIPSQPGTLTLPEVRVPWFNTRTKQTEYAILPEKRINVEGNASAVTPTIETTPLPTRFSQGMSDKQEIVQDISHKQSQLSMRWWSHSSSILVVMWLITLLMWWRHAHRITLNKTASPDSQTFESKKQAWTKLMKSVETKRPDAILNALLIWLNAVTEQNFASLVIAQRHLKDEKLDAHINALYEYCYGSADKDWSPDTLRTDLHALRKKLTQDRAQTQTLAPLYQ